MIRQQITYTLHYKVKGSVTGNLYILLCRTNMFFTRKLTILDAKQICQEDLDIYHRNINGEAQFIKIEIYSRGFTIFGKKIKSKTLNKFLVKFSNIDNYYASLNDVINK